MGLNHPADLEAWSRWHHAQQPLTRRARASLDRLTGRHGGGESVLSWGGPHPEVVVALDAMTPTALGALLAPTLHLPPESVAVISPAPLGSLLPPGWTETTGTPDDLLRRVMRPSTSVLALGHYLRLGRASWAAATELGSTFVTVQHGLLTPRVPPLAPATLLLAWSEEDAAFWAKDRPDVTHRVVGSQLLWDAGRQVPRSGTADGAATPVFLGQIHGVELPRRVTTAAAEAFCRRTGASYRPHPAETDRRSRATHRRFEQAGIRIDRTGTPLRELGAPVVSIFSTGVLEAAAAGLPAWVHLPDPPAWVREFWTRYSLSPWGGPPTPSPERSEVEPSRRVADALQGMMGP